MKRMRRVAVGMDGQRLRTRRSLLVLMVAAVAVSVGSALAAVALAGALRAGVSNATGLRLAKTDVAQVDDPLGQFCVPGIGWTDVPGMTATFRAAGKSAEPALVTFSGILSIRDANQFLWIQVLVDGQPIGPGGPVATEFSDVTSENTVSTTVLTPPLSPGSHTVNVQMEASAPACTAGKQTLVIQHY